jgi:methylase of polypeptide subunit release factors
MAQPMKNLTLLWGTWEQQTSKATYRYIVANTDWVFQIDNKNDSRGTYRYEGHTASFVTTDEWEDSQWESELSEPEIFTLSENGKILTSKSNENSVYTKIH